LVDRQHIRGRLYRFLRVQPQFPDAGLPSPQFFWFTEWEVGYGGGAAPAAPATIAAGYAESGGAYNATTVDPVGPFFQAYNDHWWFPTPATLPAGQDVKMHASKSINNIGVGASPHASMLNSQYLLGFLENHLPADFDRRYDQMYRQKGLYVISLNMAGSVPDAADLVVSDPIQAGVMAVMAIADTATFDIVRQQKRRY